MAEKEIIDKLRSLKFTGMQETVLARIKEAREYHLDYEEFLKLLLQDEQELRKLRSLVSKIRSAKFEEIKTLEELDVKRYCSQTRMMINHLSSSTYLNDRKNIIILGPTGTGKTHLAQALGHDACRRGKKVIFVKGSNLVAEFNASRSDDSWQKVLNKYSKVDLLIIDDFGLKPLSQTAASDFYELIAARHIKGNFIITSNRKTEGWHELFPDPVMACAALDRIIFSSYNVVLDGESYRKNFIPNLPKGG
jgi:DNA replication protein DnaC